MSYDSKPLPMDASADTSTPRRPKGRDTGATPQPLQKSVVVIFAVACGLSVANVYFAHPLLDSIGHDLSIGHADIGIVVTITQVGYALGLIAIVPLGDLVDRRRLIVGQAIISAAALVAVGAAPTAAVLLPAFFLVGLMAVAVQVLVAFAATLASPSERGQVVGLVTSGVVVGILLARFVSGTLSDLGGWRSVYFASAVVTLMMAALLYRTMPHLRSEEPSPRYGELLLSLARLFRDEPLLRTRAVLAMLIFASFNILWAPLVFPLSAPPYALSHTQVGLFGLAGVAGALGASRAGRAADEGHGQRTTGLALGAMLVAWIPIAFLGRSLWMLVAGIVILDFAIQAVHVTSQSMLFALRPEARSRLVAGYMCFYSIGSACGAFASTAVYAGWGWPGVCGLGAAVGLAALVFWAVTRNAGSSGGR